MTCSHEKGNGDPFFTLECIHLPVNQRADTKVALTYIANEFQCFATLNKIYSLSSGRVFIVQICIYNMLNNKFMCHMFLKQKQDIYTLYHDIFLIL